MCHSNEDTLFFIVFKIHNNIIINFYIVTPVPCLSRDWNIYTVNWSIKGL